MRKLLIAMIVLGIYAAVAFPQEEPRPYIPFPNPVDNDQGCYLAVVDVIGSQPELWRADQKIGDFSRGPPSLEKYYYYYDMNGFADASDYIVKTSHGSKVVTVEDGSGNCAQLPQPPPPDMEESSEPLEGVVSSGAFGTAIRTVIQIFFARPLEVSIQPTEQSTVPRSLQTIGNSLTYTLTVRNLNSFPIDARIDNPEDIAKPATLSITRAGTPLGVGRIATLAAGGELSIPLSVSSPDECPNVGESCRKDFSIKVSSYQGTRKIGDITVSAAYVLISSPPPKIRPVEGEATEKEGAINSITREGSTTEYSFYVFDDEVVNSAFIPYDVLLSQKKLSGRGTWAVSVQSPVRLEEIVQPRVDDITEIKDGMKRITVRVTPPYIAPPNDLKPGEEATFEITAKRGTIGTGSSVTIRYTVTHHGDGICDPDETTATYPQDCKAEEFFECAFGGRCERQEDNGVSFSATLNAETPQSYDFLVCDKAVSESECTTFFNGNMRNCGFDSSNNWNPKKCIGAESGLPEGENNFIATSKCADTSGGYYLLAVLRGRTPSTIRSANTYGYECPFIDIKTITEYIKNLNADKLQFQRARDAKNLEISTEENIDIKSRHVLCRDTYESIIPDISNAISLLQDLKANPSLSKASGIYGAGNDLYSWYNKFSDGRIPGSIYYRETQGCFQGRGSILQIESATFTSASIKAGDTVSVHVDVTKTGSQDYYGTVSCDITKPGERTQSIKLTPECVQMSEKKRFAAELTTANSGALVGTCTVYGSLKSDCSDATVHDQKDVSGSVYSIQYSASSVSGSNAICADATGAAAAATIPCTVTLNGNEQAKTGFAAHPKFSDASFTCARCSITRSGGETRECTFTSRNGLSSIFSCQAAGVGTYNLKGYVIDSEDCKPATPQDSQTSGKLSTDYLCYGPGDGSLTAGEECDPARTAQQTVTDCNRLGRSSPHWTCSQQSRCVDRIAPTISEMRVTAPSTLLASTNEVARCKYDEQDKPYNGMTSAETPYDTSHSWTVLGLTNTPRTLYIKCTDGTNIGTATFDASLSAACTGTAPPNALLCVGDDSGLTTGASRTLVDQCSANKCEYTCDASSGYQKQGTGCVKPNELPVINRVVMQGSCIIGNSITVSCAASDPDGTLATGSGVIKINGAAQPATFANGVYTTSTYPITQTAGTEIKATCAVTDSSRESTNLTSRLCTVQICPTAPTFNSIVMTPEEPLKGGLVEIRFTSSGALTQNPQVIITAGAIQAAAAIDLSRSSGSNYVYSARLPAYAGDATLVIRGQSEANCIGEATRPFLAVASAGAAKPSSVIITANPAAIFADGRTRSTIAATFRDANGAPMPYESSVRMSTTSGALSSMFCSTKSDESTCFTYLTSSTTPGQATVTAQWNSLSDSTSVSFLTPAPTDIYPPNIFNPKPVSGSTVQTRTQSVSIMTDEAATCSYATQPNAVSMTAMTPANGGSLHTASLILAEGANSIYFRCRDLALNENTDYPYVITYQATAGGGTACTGGAPSGTGVVKGPETYTAGYTPTSWAYDGTATTATPCKWKCDAGYGQSGSTCVQQTFSCTGTPPSNSEQCQSDSTRLTQDTPITLASSCGEPKCEYVCSSSHTKQGNQCEPLSPYVCLGQVPSNAELCSNDNTDLTQSTQITLASSCTSPKCEYICSSGYAKQGSTCISTDGTACGAGTLPASLAGVEQGPAVYTGSALSWSYQQSGDLTACKWRCGFGFAQSGNACAPAFAVGLSTTPETPLVNQQFTMDITFAGTAKLFVRGISSGDKICNSSPCQFTDTKTTAGAHAYTFLNADLSQQMTKTVNVRASNAPSVEPVFADPSICQTGGAVRLKCRVSDADAADRESLGVEFFVGKCDPNTRTDTTKCFDTREWRDLSATYRLAGAKESTGLYSVLFDIPSGSSGKGIAATCRATDATGEVSQWGDAYPVCVVDVCDSAPRIVTLQTYRGTESAERTQFIKTETLTIKFRSDTPGIEPAVRIRSGTSEYAAARQGTSTNPYEFRLALAEVPAGPAQVIVAGIKDDSCIGSRLADITVQETAAELFGTEPSSLRLTSSAFTEASGGKKKATVTATFLDAAGNPVSFAAAMAFEVMEGVAMISPPTCSTTSAQSSCAVEVTEISGDTSVRARTSTLTSNTLQLRFSSAAACTGTGPVSSAGIVKSTVPGSGTWGYKASGTLNACEWRCDDTHIKEGNSCVPKTITTGADCTNIPQFSEICPGDNANSPSILVDACTEATKCEYMCVAGRKREGSTCVLPQAGTSTPGRPVSLRAVSNPTSIETGGGSRTSEITATFLNNAGNLLPFSGTITFTTNLGNLIQTSCTTTSEQSSCGVMLQSADTAGIAKVTATWGNISNNANVIFTSPATDTTPPNVLNPQPQETVTALPMTLYVQTDESARCRYSRTPGTAYGNMSSLTTSLGRAHQWTLDGLTNGLQRFYIRCEDERGNAAQQDFQHSFLLDVPGNQQVTLLRISPSNPSIQANGVSTSAITARFTNNAGETLATARTIDFTTTAGTLLQNSCSTTTSETTCSVTLRSSTTPGIASVRGVSGSLSDETGVQFTEQAQPSCTGTPPANSDICSGDNTGLSTDTPITLVSSCGTPKCEYACRTGFTKQGSTCVPQTFSCTGTAPSNSELCFNDNTGLTINTSVTLVGACGSAKCEYTCASGYTKQGSICEPSSPFICTGQIPPNSDLCLNDNTGLSVSTPITLTDSCGAPKCEYRCASGFVKQGTACVAAPISVCTGTPPSSSEQCQGDSTGLTQNTQITLVNSCGTPKCEYVCGSGYTKQGNQCEPLSPYVCLGQVPSNAELCLNDNTGLTQNTQITIANSCTAAKCEYVCSSGFTRQGSTCVPTGSGTELRNTEITSVSVPNETLITTSVNVSISITNLRGEARSALVTCRFNSTAATSPCISLAASGSAAVQISSQATAPGPMPISCSVNSTTSASCQNTALDHTYPTAVSTLVTEPKMLYILSGSVPQSVTTNTLINAQMRVRNPIEVRYGRVSCTFDRPGGSTVINSSQCLPVGQNLERVYSVPTYADVSGIWTLNSCNVTTSRSSDCSLIDNVSARTFSSAINVLDRTQLTINSISALLPSIQLGDETAVNVSVSNPGQIDKFAKVSCRVTRPSGGQNQYTSACTPMAFQTSQQFMLNFTPTMAGTWSISSCSVDGSVNSDCSSASQEDNVASSSRIEVLSAGSQFIQPAVSVSHSPADPNLGDTVSVTGTSSSTNIRQIKIFVDDGVVSCSTSPCTYSATYRSGTHRYYATVENTFLQTARDPPGNNSYKTFTVSPTAGNGTQAAGCSIVITSPSCTFNSRTSRYEVSAVYNWRGGDHSRTIIDGLEKIQTPGTSNFTYSEALPTPGDKTIIAKVQDSSSRDLCSTSTRVTCSPAAPKEELVVTREMPDVSKPGFIAIRLSLAPGRDINNFTIKEHVIQGLSPLNLAVQSNTSFANISGPRSVSLDHDYSQYTIATSLKEGRNISISYRLNIDKEGEYEFLSVSEYEGKKKEERATILVTNCEQPVYTLAVSPDGECKKFRTACEVPFDWRKVDQCPLLKGETDATGEEGGGGDSTLAIIVVVVVLVALIILSWRYEDEIREKIKELKKRIENWREGKEEKKPWEDEYRANSA